ncbi:AAA family ATPase [Acetobacter sp.]|uniref:AAA family ATPase n=1 Tax=Acetobacter sp. TaxID=440 RepID=UPI0039EAF950
MSLNVYYAKGKLSLHIRLKNIGRISDATIDLNSFTMFLGKNDSGKTYAAASIWSLINEVKNAKAPSVGFSLPKLNDVLHRAIENEAGAKFACNILAEDLNELQKKFIEYFNKKLPDILAESIGYDGFQKSGIFIEGFSHQTPLKVEVSYRRELIEEEVIEATDEGDEVHNICYEDIEYAVNIYKDQDLIESISNGAISFEGAYNELQDLIVEKLIGYSCFGGRWSILRNVLYLPAARTGIMLALNYFIDGAVQRAGRHSQENFEEDISGLPAPIRNFATTLATTSLLRRRVWWGRRSIKGDVEMQSNPISKIVNGKFTDGKRKGDFLFTPNDSELTIPLPSASSLVTELAALSLFHRQIRNPIFLIFEEPEAHLHLEAQRDMAKYLAHFVNSGNELLVTTHSDTFIQQINNLICISDHPKKLELKAQLGLSEDEEIKRDKISAYDFVCKKGKTTPTELELTRTGFVAKSLNEVLLKLANETVAINSEIDENN